VSGFYLVMQGAKVHYPCKLVSEHISAFVQTVSTVYEAGIQWQQKVVKTVRHCRVWIYLA